MTVDPTLDAVRGPAKTLTDRVLREIKRLASDHVGPTEMVGGWARIGAALDQFLGAVFVTECVARGRDATSEFRRIVRGAYELERATAGQLAHALNVLGAEDGARVTALASLFRDVASPDSVLGAVIELRNALVHSRREPTSREAIPILESLATLLRETLAEPPQSP